MPEELLHKVAIITGGASGMGAGTARLFVREGCRVVIADVQDARGEAMVSELGGTARFIHCDVSKLGDVQATVQCALDEFGCLDIMFNNAGVLATPKTNDLIQDEFDDFWHTIGVDLYGVMVGTRCAAKAMVETGGGAIINTASTTATVPGLGSLTYRAAKAGVLNFTLNAAIALGKHRIRVNAISPGGIATDVLTFGMDLPDSRKEEIKLSAFRAMMHERQPLKRLGMPEDIANAALFLASDRALQITGLNLIVSGGEHLGDAEEGSKAVTDALGMAPGGN